MFNIKACNFREFEGISQGAWPISEINILIKEGLISIDDVKGIYGNISREEIINIFNKVFLQYRNCNFDLDYDCDGIINPQDNCPYVYNPNQYDLDND